MRRDNKSDWKIDLAAQTATHESGLVVEFIGEVSALRTIHSRARDGEAFRADLERQHGLGASHQMIRRLRREAAEMYDRAQARARHQEA